MLYKKASLILITSCFVTFCLTRNYYFYYLDNYEVIRMCDCLEDGRFIQFNNIENLSKRGLDYNPKRFWLKYQPKGRVFYGNCETLKNVSYYKIKHRRSKRFEIN